MSAPARWFNLAGKTVAGYDRVQTPLTDSLAKEGIEIHFDDDFSSFRLHRLFQKNLHPGIVGDGMSSVVCFPLAHGYISRFKSAVWLAGYITIIAGVNSGIGSS